MVISAAYLGLFCLPSPKADCIYWMVCREVRPSDLLWLMSCENESSQYLSLLCQSVELLMQDHLELFPSTLRTNTFQDSGSFDSLSHEVWGHSMELTYDAHVMWMRNKHLLLRDGFCWLLGFPSSSVGKESACNAGDPSSIPGSGRSSGEEIDYPLQYSWASLVAQLVKDLPAIWETWVQSLGWEDPLKKGNVPTPVFWPG